jgi:curved DNA-binding protein CbpA
MPAPLDPYRTLGLSPAASRDEIRRAYRRLAKANHPDAAGEANLPRFLAIQAAYEMLLAPAGRSSAARAGARRPSPPSEPWQADPARGRATRDAYTRRRSSGAGTGGAKDEPGRSGAGADAGGAAGGAAGDAAGAGAGTAGAGPRKGGRRPRTSGSTERQRRPGGPSGSREGRAPNKATLGSTSYDAAEDEPFDPEWSGGTWYGASSGTYWTINPKEYADPRKHGPEYQRRARRRLDGLDPEVDDGPSLEGDDFDDEASRSQADEADRSRFDGRWTYPDEVDGHWDWSGDPETEWTDWRAADEPEPAARPSLVTIGRELLAGRVGFAGRFVLAFVAWLPIGAFIAWLSGELSGCGRFTASCVDASAAALIPQALVYGLLVALPPLAAISATGTVGALAVSVPAAVVLSAVGGSHQPEASGAIITIAFFVGYVAGAAFAVGRRLGWRRVP